MSINLYFICKILYEDSFWNRGSRFNVTRTRCIDCAVPKPKRLQYNGHAITAIVSKRNEPMRSPSKDTWPAPSESQVTVSLGITSHWFSLCRTGLFLGVADTGHVTVKHRFTNLLFLLFSSFFCRFVLYCFTSTVSSTPSRSLNRDKTQTGQTNKFYFFRVWSDSISSVMW